MSTETVKTMLVPGAWMGAWIWEPIAQRLTERRVDVETVTLRGLEPAQNAGTIAAVRLEDHARQLLEHVNALDLQPVVLVSHSYSTMPTALVADRLGGQVRGLIHIGGFPPADGRSLLLAEEIDFYSSARRERMAASDGSHGPSTSRSNSSATN